jgi:hypothetical protein
MESIESLGREKEKEKDNAETLRARSFAEIDANGRGCRRNQKRNEKPATICALLCHWPNMCVAR